MPASARTPGTVSCSSPGEVEPQPSLMLRPFGEQPIGNDLRAEVGERARHDLVAGAVRAIDDELHAFERHALGQRFRAELLVVTARLVDARARARDPSTTA